MPRPPSDKRERLTDAAVELARTTGLEATTLAAIADRAGVPQGSVYYYFKTKADVAAAVADGIADLLASRRAGYADDARAALGELLASYADDAAAIRSHGSLLATASAVGAGDRAHREAITWAAERFELLGFAAPAARARAIHLIAAVEGGAALAHALDDESPLEQEAAHLERWVANASA